MSLLVKCPHDVEYTYRNAPLIHPFKVGIIRSNMEDLYNAEKRLETVLNKIKNSNILESNKQRLSEFTTHCLADSVGKNKASRYLYDMVNIAEWLGKPFEDANKKDIERIMICLENATKKDMKGNLTNIFYSPWTKRGYKVIIRKFYKWLRDSKSFPDEVDWIKIAIKENQKKLPEHMLSEQEIMSLINATPCIRDKALIAVLFDCGCRVGELMNMTIGRIEYFGKGMKVHLSGKTGERKIPLMFSAPYLALWLNNHPTKKPESCVWVRRNGERLSYGRVRDLLKDCAKNAGITKHVNPHNFRHSRASFYSDKLSDRVMMSYFGWRKSDTIAVYSHLNGSQVDNAIMEANGIVPEEKKEKTILNPKICQRCKKSHDATALYCTCGYPLDAKLVEETKQAEIEKIFVDKLMNEAIKDPEIWNLIKSRIKLK